MASETDRPVKKSKRLFRCKGVETAELRLAGLEMPIRPQLHESQKMNEAKEKEVAERQELRKRIKEYKSDLVTSELVMEIDAIITKRKRSKSQVAIFLELTMENYFFGGHLFAWSYATPLQADRVFEKLLPCRCCRNQLCGWSI